MKVHTSKFKENISLLGRELDNKITFTINNVTTELGNEDLNSVESHYEGNILKSVMKQLDIDSNIEIPIGTILNYKFGVKVRNNETQDYEENCDYINFGNYVVKEVERQEDTNSYRITCYDKMLYSMRDYENDGITYPISVREYIKKICNKIGLEFANENNVFPNYDKIIENELYMYYNEITEKYESLGYTFRDIFDELSEVTAGTICINETTDKAEIRDINETNDTIDKEYLKDVNVKFGEKYGPINSIVLSRSEDSDIEFLQDEESIEKNGLCEIKISDNQIMNQTNRKIYLQDIFNKLNGLEYFINDFSSTGVGYYNLCDKYHVSIDENVYDCIMLNDDFKVSNGLVEKIYTETPDKSTTDYSYSGDESIMRQAYLQVRKSENRIISYVSGYYLSKDEASNIYVSDIYLQSQLEQTESSIEASVSGTYLKKSDASSTYATRASLSLYVEKTDNNQIVSMLNASADIIHLTSDRFILDSTYLTIASNGSITINSVNNGSEFKAVTTYTWNSNVYTTEINGAGLYGHNKNGTLLFAITSSQQGADLGLYSSDQTNWALLSTDGLTFGDEYEDEIQYSISTYYKMFYKKGASKTYNSNYVSFSGLITDSKHSLRFCIPIDRSMANVTPVITACTILARTTSGGYLDSNTTGIDAMDYSISYGKLSDTMLWVNVIKVNSSGVSTEWDNCTNNTPVSVTPRGITIQFN